MATEWVNDIHQGDAGETLAEMPESSVHMCMTSPPYFGLRDYGEDVETVWGGKENKETWGEVADRISATENAPSRKGLSDTEATENHEKGN